MRWRPGSKSPPAAPGTSRFTHAIAVLGAQNGSKSSNRVGEVGSLAFFTHVVAVISARQVRCAPRPAAAFRPAHGQPRTTTGQDHSIVALPADSVPRNSHRKRLTIAAARSPKIGRWLAGQTPAPSRRAGRRSVRWRPGLVSPPAAPGTSRFTHAIAVLRARNGSKSSNRVGEVGSLAFFTHVVAVISARQVRCAPGRRRSPPGHSGSR